MPGPTIISPIFPQLLYPYRRFSFLIVQVASQYPKLEKLPRVLDAISPKFVYISSLFSSNWLLLSVPIYAIFSLAICIHTR